MKRLSRFVPLIALLAIAITTVTLRYRGAWRAWRPMPGGDGEVRLLAVTHGTEHTIERPGPTWSDRVRMAWRARSFDPLRRQPGLLKGTPTKMSSLVFWVEGRNLTGSLRALHPGADLLLPDQQAFESGAVRLVGFESVGSAHPAVQWEVQFPFLPARSKMLRLITRWKGGRQEFVVPNPAYRTDLPVWKADPLPHTKRHGDSAFTLRGVKVMAMESARRDADAFPLWRAQPLWAVMHCGRRGDPFYEIDAVFEDSAGNVSRDIALFSEPVWKVQATIVRTPLFPFAESDVRWLGTIDPARADAQAPQAYALLPLTAERSAGRFKLVGIFGTGQFEIQLGAVTAVAALNASEAQRGTEWDYSRGVHIVPLAQPAVIIVEDLSAERDREIPIIQDQEGLTPQLRERWSGSVNRWSLRVFDLPAKPMRLGLADKDPFTLTFFVEAPKMPGANSKQ